ncbi:MAG: hypothetical protein ACPGJN_02415 [Flavobacteriaceae bacterium]|jgi:hypothetical protein
MITAKIKKPLVLSVLFFLPVLFLLFLYPSKHNYTTLDIVKSNIPELNNFQAEDGSKVRLENHLTVLGFLGENPMDDATRALNLKELVYDKFRGFKRFQIIILLPETAKQQAQELKKELNSFEPLDYWTFAFGSVDDIKETYTNLKISEVLRSDLASNDVFIIDKEKHQRGRLDDRTKAQKEENFPIYSMPSYNVLEVSELKNKMSEDMRILFTEYRQKRKGNFSSTTRRAEDLLNNEIN